MSTENVNEIVYEDISSSSQRQPSRFVAANEAYANRAFKHIDKVIKAISFIVSIGILLFFLAIAAVLILLDKIFIIVAIGVAVLGVVFSLISLFLIYALGHMISQNNEILKKL